MGAHCPRRCGFIANSWDEWFVHLRHCTRKLGDEKVWSCLATDCEFSIAGTQHEANAAFELHALSHR